jgi:ABC-type lipoprotein release transport system permease subunit
MPSLTLNGPGSHRPDGAATTSRSCAGARLIVNSQATAIGLVGLVIGIHLGIVLGRVLWRLVTDRVPLVNVAPFALLGVLLIVPASMLLANALAVWPGHRVARLQPAEILRDE